jgi:hypothetical protein
MAYSSTSDYFYPSDSVSPTQLALWISDANGIINDHLKITTDAITFTASLKAIEQELVGQQWTYFKSISGKQAQLQHDVFGNALITERHDRPMHLTKELTDKLNEIAKNLKSQKRFSTVRI